MNTKKLINVMVSALAVAGSYSISVVVVVGWEAANQCVIYFMDE